MNLGNKVVAITGANGVLGRAMARAALDAGARVALIDIGFDEKAAAFQGGAGASFHKTDLLDAESTRASFEAIGKIDALCNIAGGFTMGDPVHAQKPDVWRRMFDLNVQTLLNAVGAVVPGMVERGGGRIVNVGAMGGVSGQPFMGAYSAAKSVVIRSTESMSAELKGKGINVNCVLPSIIDTPANRADMPKANPADWVSPADLAAVMLFLISDQARAIHGAALPVRGLS